MRYFRPSLGGYDGSEDDEVARTVTRRKPVVAAVSRLSWRARTLVAIALLGVAWLIWDVVTDSEPAISGSLFDRIDAYVADQANDSRIPGISIAVVENGTVVHARGFGNDGNGNGDVGRRSSPPSDTLVSTPGEFCRDLYTWMSLRLVSVGFEPGAQFGHVVWVSGEDEGAEALGHHGQVGVDHI